MHPYMARIFATLGDRDPIAVLESTPLRLEQLLAGFDEDDLARSYAPGKWSVREIVAHLADCEIGLGFRFRQALAEEDHAVQPFDQDLWAARYPRLDPALALEAFTGLRRWNLALFSGFELIDWNRSVRYSFEGVDSIDDMVRFLAGHDLNHLAQLEAIAGGVAP
jgi:hypothetical protein